MIAIPFTFKDLYPNQQVKNITKKLKKCLQSLCLTETLKYCIHLNLFVSDLDTPLYDLTGQQVILQMFFDKQEMKRIYNLEEKGIFFHRAQLIELIRYSILYCPDTDCHRSPVQNKKSKQNFIQAALLASDIAMNRVAESLNTDAERKDKQIQLLKSVRATALSSLLIIDPARAFGRGSIIFSDYMPTEFPEFQKEFEKIVGLTLQDYFLCLFIALAHYYSIPVKQGSHLRHIINKKLLNDQIPHLTHAFTRYLEIDSQTIDDLKKAFWRKGEEQSSFTLKPIREKTILLLDADTFIVIDPIMHLEKALISPLFMLSRELEKQGINLQGHFGKAFEKYVQNILEIIFGIERENNLLLLGDDLKINVEEICDACGVQGNSMFLFEMKAAWVRDDQVFDPDETKYINELRLKYGKNGNAAFQLARAANRLISGEWKIDNHNMRDTKRVYPILICYDPILNTPGHFWFFGSEFRSAFKQDALLKGSKTIMTKAQWEIAPITIISIDILENLESSLKNFLLSDLLRDYFFYCDANFRDTEDDLSLSEFIKRKYHDKMDYRGSVSQRALKTFDELKQIIIPVMENLDRV
jgi:hypothetical protein